MAVTANFGWEIPDPGADVDTWGDILNSQTFFAIDAEMLNTLAADGTRAATANIPMGGFKITGLGLAADLGDALSRNAGDRRYLRSNGADVSKNFADAPWTDDSADGELVGWDTSGGSVIHNLPAASTAGAGYIRGVTKTTSDVNKVTVTPNGADTIEGVANYELFSQNERLFLQSDGATTWAIVRVPAADFIRYSADVNTTNGKISYDPTREVISVGDNAVERAFDPVRGEHLWPIPGTALTPTTTDGFTFQEGETVTNVVPFKTPEFDPTTKQYGYIWLRMPKKWDGGTITFDVDWYHEVTGTGYNVNWQLQAVAMRNGVAIDTPFGAAVNSNDTGGTINTLFTSPRSTAVTIGGTPQKEDLVCFRLARDAANDGDVAARVKQLNLYLNIDKGNDI
jgi:hypothetical protein